MSDGSGPCGEPLWDMGLTSPARLNALGCRSSVRRKPPEGEKRRLLLVPEGQVGERREPAERSHHPPFTVSHVSLAVP